MADPTIKRGPSSELPALGYDPTTTHAMVPLQVVSVVQDPVSGQWYGVLNVNASFSASSLSINDPNTTTQKASVDASGNLQVKLGSALPSGANVIGHVVVDSGSITANAGTNLNTSALALESGGNLATVATNTSNTATNTSNTATNTNNASTTIGTTTDVAVVGDNNGTLSAKLRGLTKILNDIWDSVNHRIKVDGSGVTQPVSGTVSVNALPAGLDNTNELKVSNYVKSSVAGDTALTLGQATMANSLPVTMASDQVPKTSATATRSNVAAAASDTSLLASNASRKGALFFNDSTAILYLAYGSATASTTSYTVQIPANGFFEMPPEPIFTGAIRGIWSAANGSVRITEMS